VWRDHSKIGAAFLVLCLLAGETYWLLLNTERELQSRAEFDAPLDAQREARRKAEQRITDAKEAKRKADSAALDQAALPGCKKNCADLLTNAVNNAKTELDNAVAALALLPRPASSTALADNIDMARWAWNLIMGALRGLAVFGGSIAFAPGDTSVSAYAASGTSQCSRRIASHGGDASGGANASAQAHIAATQGAALIAAGYHRAPRQRA
jgi:hypothetical protein